MKRDDFDKIYRTMPLLSIPWNCEVLPEPITRLLEEEKIHACRMIDLGCGAGNYAICLAAMGFDVIGVDSSKTAIALARNQAMQRGAMCRFIVADLLGDVHEVPGTFEFAYDWELLHHIFPEDRDTYIKNVHRLVRPGGLYFSACFAESDPQFGGAGKYRETPLGTTLYFSSEEEIRNLLSPHFTILELETVEVAGKTGPHNAICVLAGRR
jgi:2-polyprenyl-3-methyl-5-hydroxy-6-metoxy-1,4-benzoquinol methylase